MTSLLLLVSIVALAYGIYISCLNPVATNLNRNSPSPPPSTSALFGRPSRTPQGVILLGRRGIIKQISPFSIMLAPTDTYAQPGELLEIRSQPSTSYVLVTIHARPQPNGEAVNRIPSARDNLSVNDDIFVISNHNIAASTSFSAIRIEKIMTP